MLRRFCLFVMALLLVASCKDDDSTSDPRLPYFKKIVVLDNVTVELSHGDKQMFRITGDGDLSGVQRGVVNQVLTVADNDPDVENVVIHVSHPDIDSIAVRENGKFEFVTNFFTTASQLDIVGYDAAEILSVGEVTVDVLDIDLRNAGRLAIRSLSADSLDVQLRDGSRCNVEGFARMQKIDMDNGCRFNLDFPIIGWAAEVPVKGDSCWIEVDNGANGWVYPTEYLNAKGNTGSRVFLKGGPAVIEKDMENGATLEAKDN